MSRIWEENLYQVDAYLNEMPDVISFKDKNLEDFKDIIQGHILKKLKTSNIKIHWPIFILIGITSHNLVKLPLPEERGF